MPVFAEDELVAWTANIAHWNDVGGMVPGSISNEATRDLPGGPPAAGREADLGGPADPFGRRDREGEQQAARLPARRHVGGDRGGPSSASGGSSSSFGATAPRRSSPRSAASWTTASRSRGGRSRELPKGVFRLEEEQDSGAVYRVAVEITRRRVRRRSARQPDPGLRPEQRLARRRGHRRADHVHEPDRSSRAGATRGTTDRCACSPGRARSSTRFRRPRSPSTTRCGCGCTTSSGVASRHTSAICCPPATSARSAARSSAGRHPDTGRHFTIVEPQVGGWGGSASRDGNSRHVQRASTGTRSTARPRWRRHATACTSTGSTLDDGPGGEGEHRGGKGIVLEYRVRSNGCFLTCAYTRNRHPPWAVAGGRAGSPNRVEVIRVERRRRGARSRDVARGQ